MSAHEAPNANPTGPRDRGQKVIEVHDLKKHFPVTKGLILAKTVGWVKAVDGVSFDIGEGETLGLVGESGCGKTTTSKVILKLDRPTSGRVLFFGQDIATLKGKALGNFRAQVQAVFQDPWASLNPRMRIKDIISEAIVVNHKLPPAEARERTLDVMQEVGLPRALAGNFPHEFSGGQRQRIAVASALASDPKLIVLDEPVSALDVSIRAQIMNLLKDIQDKHRVSYLLIAHNLATVRYLAGKTAVMYLGRIVEAGDTDELYEHPLHPYTRALFSAALPSDPDEQRDDVILTGEVPSPVNPPSGCHFHPRCTYARDICKETDPELKQKAPGHEVACHLF